MKKFTIVCIAAATLMMMGSCGNKNKKAADAVEEQVEVIVEECCEDAEKCCEAAEECCEAAAEAVEEAAAELVK